jgi:peptidoglycan/xylan/chitin deacetylase (PgdA/CDA1 family)
MALPVHITGSSITLAGGDTEELEARVGALESITARRPQTSRGAVAFSWDDGWSTHPQVAQWHAERGQVATFYVTVNELDGAQHMPTSAVAAIHALGHEIGAHNLTHTSMTSGTDAAGRTAQWDDAKAALEALTGEPVVSYAYPLGDHSATTDTEAYGRYDRVAYTGLSQGFVGSNTTKAGNWLLTPDFQGFGHGRFPWSQQTHAQFMEILRSLVHTDVTVPVYTHQVGNSDSPTEAQVLEALDYCASRGIRTLTARDATPAPMILNPSFERGLDGWTVIPGGTGGSASVVEVVEDVPALGLGGTHSLRITSAASTTSDSVRVLQTVPVRPGEQYVLSGRLRHDGDKSGSGTFTLRLNEYDAIGKTVSGRNIRSAASGSDWTAVSLQPTTPTEATWLPPNSFHPDTRLVEVEVYLSNVTGTFYADHIHFGPVRNGILG